MRYRTALVTGASSGIGRHLAEQLASGGCEVVLAARRIRELEAVASGIRCAGGAARVLQLDVADAEATFVHIQKLDRDLGGFDLIVANAGLGAPRDVAPYSWAAIRGAFHVNFCGAAATLTAALPAMVERGRGHLVAISSLASFGPLPASIAYCAPKAGLSMMMACLELDLA